MCVKGLVAIFLGGWSETTLLGSEDISSSVVCGGVDPDGRMLRVCLQTDLTGSQVGGYFVKFSNGRYFVRFSNGGYFV